MARIKIDPDRQIGRVDRRIFGGFIEHLGRCIYGGIFEEGSPLSDERGFRRDVLDALRPLRMPLLRWPGGNFVSGYHWTDGIGPVDQRPKRLELAWNAVEPNRFGTDEFIEYCRVLGTEPYICVNTGSGSMDEAQAWVEYCNGTKDTYWANLRRKHGHEEPYRVKYWGLGNEMYGHWQIGALSPEAYVAKAREFAKVMKLTDPTIQLVSCGRDGWSDWDRIVIQGLARYVDYHSIHIYTGSPDFYRNVTMPLQAERALRICQAYIDQARYEQRIDHPIKVAYDEWNVWYRERSPAQREAGLEERYDLADALAVATFLNVFLRQCRTIAIANLAQAVNVIAPVFTSPTGLFLQTIYHPLRLYAEHIGDIALDPLVDCETFELTTPPTEADRPHRVDDLAPFPYLDVAATCDSSGRQVTIAVVNRDRDHDHATTIELFGGKIESAMAFEVNGPEPGAVNSFEQPDLVGVTKPSVEILPQGLRHVFPAHSVTVLRVELR